MERFEHCMVEYRWSRPSEVDDAPFNSFVIFHADGRGGLG